MSYDTTLAIEIQVCGNHKPCKNMVCAGKWACDRIPFMTRPVKPIIFLYLKTTFLLQSWMSNQN